MNANRRNLAVVFVVMLALGGLATACAKRPALQEVRAPAPTPVVVTPTPTPPPAPQALAPPAPAPAAPAPAPPAPVVVPPPPPPAEFAANPALADIHFDFDKSAIRAGDAKILDATAGWLKDNPKALVLIEGHCDERGTNEYNLALGERRAEAARAYLVSQGVDRARMSTISYGEERPSCTQSTEACWARNRRGHFLTKSQ